MEQETAEIINDLNGKHFHFATNPVRIKYLRFIPILLIYCINI